MIFEKMAENTGTMKEIMGKLKVEDYIYLSEVILGLAIYLIIIFLLAKKSFFTEYKWYIIIPTAVFIYIGSYVVIGLLSLGVQAILL